VLPVEGFVDERDALGATAAKQDGVDRDPLRGLPSGVDDWALVSRRAKPGNKKKNQNQNNSPVL
jgi:hypothetical protein